MMHRLTKDIWYRDARNGRFHHHGSGWMLASYGYLTMGHALYTALHMSGGLVDWELK
jgi:hypothetical protein